ncbi:BglII/BstYI family type II restriction endonuclease [Mycobacteroides abscessus]|uniref:BglII/BstYI family type II restriction endonuclease n=1 Tax=Mycobacteroides abscessus TaxID=36809 RepID=UPI00092A4965|nr:BglII/BstYI family type II restriction endonuclease [Mycobacteroides abscessus]SHW64402.1 Restriction endonuclease BglII [Mycobacteroides abscessus subsp. abscessus]SHZ89652.1 Restriction endonuclease BglII [Mycobacteroides abscessus subsp. abscessus]SKQ83152.1 Restriction endonuclease BglII [Mycobacteroides abscessus subsp. abscessus]
MDLTTSYEKVIPAEVRARYQFVETRNAAAVLMASNPDLFDEIIEVLTDFTLYSSDILTPGGNRGQIPIRLDSAFEKLGWSAVRITTEWRLLGERKVSAAKRDYEDKYMESSVRNPGFEVDNMKGRVALDVEWNAKDGNLDRDLSAYRSLYEVGLIDVAVIITRDHAGIRNLALEDLKNADAARRLGTTTTTNIEKVRNRMTRGDSGGCPVLVVAITRNTWEGHADK